MPQKPTFNPFNKCKFCGSTKGYKVHAIIKQQIWLAFDFNNTFLEKESTDSDPKKTKVIDDGKVFYCLDCGKKIARKIANSRLQLL